MDDDEATPPAKRNSWLELRDAKKKKVTESDSSAGKPASSAGGKEADKTGAHEQEQQARSGLKLGSGDEILPALAKLTLSHSDWIRRILPAIDFVTVLVPSDAKIITFLKTSLKQYADAIAKEGRGHSCGPPEAWILLDFVEDMKSTPPRGTTAEQWGALLDHIRTLTPEEASSQYLSTLKMGKGFSKKGEPAITKVTFKAPCKAVHLALHTALSSSEGAKVKVGTAPRGPLERELQTFLDKKVAPKKEKKK